MRELQISNHALGHRAELARLLDEQGYWFFRGVLAGDAFDGLQGAFLDILREVGLVDEGSRAANWNGTPLKRLPLRLTGLRERRAWQTFVADPAIETFFADLLEGPVNWLSSDYYRIVPPCESQIGDAFAARHQDGYGLPGLDFLTCWFALGDIDSATGGIVLMPGSHRHGIVPERWFDDTLFDGEWARADYRTGDLLMFVPGMMHSGMINASDRNFRLSMDIRVMPQSSIQPIFGTIHTITPERVVIATCGGECIELLLDASTQLRGCKDGYAIPIRIGLADGPAYLPTGTGVMATSREGRALLLRPFTDDEGLRASA